jgi:hypothetical protein
MIDYDVILLFKLWPPFPLTHKAKLPILWDTKREYYPSDPGRKIPEAAALRKIPHP